MAIPDHFTIQFGKNFEQAAQQTESRFRKAAILDTACSGEAKTHNLDMAISANNVTGERLAHTILQEIETEKRWSRPEKFDIATYDIPFDEVLLKPTVLGGGRHVMAHGGAYARSLDAVFVAGAFGTNYKGKAGVTATEIPAANVIAVDFVSSGSATDSSITVDKILRAKTILRSNEAYGDDAVARGIQLWGAMTPEMEENLLFLANASGGAAANRLFSRDYMPPTLDANGNISFFLGINWIRSTLLPIDETDTGIQYAGLWTSDAIHLDIWKEKTMKVSERPDLKYATQFFTEYAFGAVRQEDKKVVKIACAI